jgi:hypothetical protein
MTDSDALRQEILRLTRIPDLLDNDPVTGNLGLTS